MRRGSWSETLGAGLVLALVGTPAAVDGQVGPEFQINTYTTSRQAYPVVTTDADGDFVVVWQSYGQEGPGNGGVVGQRYDADGNSLGTEFQINTYTTNRQGSPTVAMDDDGDFVVVWDSGGQDGSTASVFGQRYDSGGTALGMEFQINTYTTSRQAYPVVTADADGDFVVVWDSNSQDGDGYGVFGQRYASNGTAMGGEFQINTYTTSYQTSPSVSSDADGNFVVVWDSYGQDGDGFGIFGQRYSSDGSELGDEFQINTYTTSFQRAPAISTDADGNFVVAWSGLGQDGDGYGAFGQRFSSDGSELGDEFQINTYTTGGQVVPSLSTNDDGTFTVVWTSTGQDGDGYGVFGQRYASDGDKTGDEFRVNTYTTSGQILPSLSTNDDGSFTVVWQSYEQDGGERPNRGDGSDFGIFGAQSIEPDIFFDGFESGDTSRWN